MAWLQGMYVYEVLMDVAPYIKAFSKERPKAYPKEPYDLFKEQREAREEREAKERYERIKAGVAAFAKAQKERREKESKEQEVDGDGRCVPQQH